MSISNPANILANATDSAVKVEKSIDIQVSMVDELVARTKQGDEKSRTKAWLSAPDIGAVAIKALCELMAEGELEVARAAKRGLWKIVRHAGRPRAGDEKNEVIAELISLLGTEQPISVSREVLWMLSEIGGDESVSPIADALSNKYLREDARMALERIPGKKSLAALEASLKTAPEDFKLNIAQSLRQRSVKVRGLACMKLVPTKKTNVKPIRSE